MISTAQRVFISFLIFGLLNNVLYVVNLTAAVDIVGYTVPKAVVLLADIVPSLSIKILAPFFIHYINYKRRIWILLYFSLLGMLLVSLSGDGYTGLKLLGISMASISSGLGEVSFLQLTHFYNETKSIGGFSMGTGGAGIVGSFCFLIMTNVWGLDSWVALTIFAVLPLGFPIVYFYVLPEARRAASYDRISQEHSLCLESSTNDHLVQDAFPIVSQKPNSRWTWYMQHFKSTIHRIYPLIRPYMIPLSSVYIAEYVINQGISPTLLFPLTDLPHWLFGSYRDIYVVYGFVYQLGVFLSRSSLTFGFHFQKLYILSFLQILNVFVALHQSLYDAPFKSIYSLMLLIFYEGLLGGLSYVNTFVSVSQNVQPELREFSMACVGISDSFGIMVAGLLNLWLERSLCAAQVSRGRDWCRNGV